MLTCENCQRQMLPMLYDLLDAQEREDVAAHLESCAGCQAALQMAREQHALLAEAVKEEHANVVFKAPAQAVQPAPPATLPMPHAARPRRLRLNRWGAAAAILFVLFATGGTCGWIYSQNFANERDAAQLRLAKVNDDLLKSKDKLNTHKLQQEKDMSKIREQVDVLFQNWQQEEVKARKVLEENPLQLIVNGPQVAVAGARNYYDVVVRQQNSPYSNTVQDPYGLGKENKTKDASQAAPMIPLQVQAVNQLNNDVVYQQEIRVQSNQKGQFALPEDFPITPNADLALVFQTRANGKDIQLRDNLKVVLPEYVTHLTTDRPMYRPGEVIRFRSLTLERFSLKPAQEPFHLRFRIIGPNNREIFKQELSDQLVGEPQRQPVKGPDGKPLHGLGAGEFMLPADLPSGQYSLIVNEVNDRFSEEKRTFQVHRWQAPRFNKELQFNRPSYGAGDQVKVNVRVVPVQGAGSGRPMSVVATFVVDGVNVGNAQQGTDNEGRATLECQLPAQILQGVGVVTVQCDDNGTRETFVRSIPIVVRDLRVDFYPEGGDLIAGVPNRVYFQVRTPAGKPADLEGRLIAEEIKQEIVHVKTLTDEREAGINQGLGSFTFTPQPNRIYKLKVDSPIGIDRHFLLPSVNWKGVVLHVPHGVVEKEIPLTLHSIDKARELFVGAYCRGRLLEHAFVKIGANQSKQVTLKPVAGVAGVYRITVFEKSGTGENVTFLPLAERLIYRKSTESVEVEVVSDRPSYQPGNRVRLSLQAKNEKKQPTPAVALVAVVDASVGKLADEKTARSMPTHFLLTTEVRKPEELENADVLLGTHPKAAQALDLLLGTQGWRRFAEQDPVRFQRTQQPARPPVFLANSSTVPQFLNGEQKQIEKLDQEYVAKVITLQQQLAKKASETNDAAVAPLQQEMETLAQQAEQIRQEVASAEARTWEIRALVVQFGMGGALLTVLFTGFFLVSVGLNRLAEGRPARDWLFSGVALLSMLFLASLLGTFILMGENSGFFLNRFQKEWAPAVKTAAPPMNPAPQSVIDEATLEIDANQLEFAKGKMKDGEQMRAPAPRPPQEKQAALAQQQQGLALNMDVWMPNTDKEQGPDEKREPGDFHALLQKRLGRRVQLPPANDPSIVREYAHKHAAAGDNVRRDFTETVYWHPVLVLPDGKGEVSFDLSDSITRYEVLVLSTTLDGRIGASRAWVTSKLPFSVEPKVPIEVANTDQITIPVAVNNDQNERMSTTLTASVMGLRLDQISERGVNLEPNERRRVFFPVRPNISEGDAVVLITAKTTGVGDAVERRFQIVPDGFPVSSAVSGTLEGPVDHLLTLPEGMIAGTLKVQAHFYPSPLAELQNGLAALLQEPTGCFEQSSSSNYPNVLILNYLQKSNQNNPLIEKRARQLLQSGYDKLTAFECIDPAQASVKRGYEWFGQTAPPHEALTAYGLMQFRDMDKVHRVDSDMIQRTEKYLLAQRDAKGGFRRNPRALDGFGQAPEAVTNAYIVWALTASGSAENLDKELAALRELCKQRKDPYILALAGLSHLNSKNAAVGTELLKQVASFQQKDGHIGGAATSITGSQGRDLQVETTALAVLGWLKADRAAEFNPNVQSAMRWLGQQRRGAGSFGATQATILALKAMIEYTQGNPKSLKGGEVQMDVQARAPLENPADKEELRPVDFDPIRGIELPMMQRANFAPRSQETITLTADPKFLMPGKNTVHLDISANNALPYTLAWSYRTLKPANDAQTPLRIVAKLNAESAREGATVKLMATIENASGKAQGMAVAVIGLPGGLALPHDFQQLKELARVRDDGTKPGVISAWELRGRELVLYWRELGPKAKIDIDLDLICRLPGQYRGPASRAYLYYDAERKHWIAPLDIRIIEVE